MAYSELIKDFGRIREYMRQFYVYGFRTRDEYDGKSARSYDNERRRIESWLGEYMSFRQDSTGKVTFISVDSRSIMHNPLYRAFKAKSFTDNDITLHFYILDIIREYGELFNIVPFQADKDSYTKLKDVSAVLADLVQKMSDMTGALQGSNEFLFVHFIMYSPNGFNVRNDCIHGRQYQDSAGVAAAFHMTVICVYMILKRLRELESYFDDDGM